MLRRVRSVLGNLAWLIRPGGLRETLAGHERRLAELRIVAYDLRRHDRSQAWVYGHHMRLDPDDTMASPELSDTGTHEPFQTEFMLQQIRPGDTVLDIGANIGYYTLLFARQVGPQGCVFAFEPDPRNFALLKLNVRQNGYTNVTLVQKAVAAQSGQLRLFRNPGDRGDHRIYDSNERRESVAVEVVTLDEFFADHRGRIAFAKMDIQGAEGAAIEGMKQVLSRNRDMRIVMEFWARGLGMCGYDPEQFLRKLLQMGYHIQVIDEKSQQILPLDIPVLLSQRPVHPEPEFFTNLFCEPGAVGDAGTGV